MASRVTPRVARARCSLERASGRSNEAASCLRAPSAGCRRPAARESARGGRPTLGARPAPKSAGRPVRRAASAVAAEPRERTVGAPPEAARAALGCAGGRGRPDRPAQTGRAGPAVTRRMHAPRPAGSAPPTAAAG
eukprot:7107560-Prymnesium_polylepis.1